MTKFFSHWNRKGPGAMQAGTDNHWRRYRANASIPTRPATLFIVIAVFALALGMRTTAVAGAEHRLDHNPAVSVHMTVTYEIPQGVDPGVLRSFRSPEIEGSPRRDQSQAPYVRPADTNSPPRTDTRGARMTTQQVSSFADVVEQNRRTVVSCALPDECRDPDECAAGGLSSPCGPGKVCCVPKLAYRSAGNASGRKPSTKNPNATKASPGEASLPEVLDAGLPAAFHGYLLLSEYPQRPPPAANSIGRTVNDGGVGSKSKIKSNQTEKSGVYDSARRGGPPVRVGTLGTTQLSKLRQKKADLLPETNNCGSVYIDSRIIKGKDAQVGQFPWMVLLGFKTPPKTAVNFICGGSLISDRYVITAAHCFTPQNILTEVRLGEYDLSKDPDGTPENQIDPIRTERVEEVVIHPNFSTSHLKHDIALVRLQNRIRRYTNTVKPVCLPWDVTFTQANYTIAGWGKTNISNSEGSNVVQTANVQVLNHTECLKRASPYNLALTTNQLCAGGNKGQDVCSGDSGGPLMKVDTGNGANDTACTYIAGIVSFGADAPCGTAPLPSVYTRVESYVAWILENMRP